MKQMDTCGCIKRASMPSVVSLSNQKSTFSLGRVFTGFRAPPRVQGSKIYCDVGVFGVSFQEKEAFKGLELRNWNAEAVG